MGVGEFGINERVITKPLIQQRHALGIRLLAEGSHHVWLAKRHIMQNRPHRLAAPLMNVVLHLSWILVLSLDLVILQRHTTDETISIYSCSNPMLIILPAHGPGGPALRSPFPLLQVPATLRAAPLHQGKRKPGTNPSKESAVNNPSPEVLESFVLVKPI